MRDEALPTFASNRDRITYLLAEFKVPLTVMVVAAIVILAFATPSIPSPPEELVNFSIAAFLLALPAYLAGIKICRYLFPGPPRVKVGVADAGTAESEMGDATGEYSSYSVLEEVWENRTETGSSAKKPAKGNCDWIVTRFNWYEDIEELEVRGVDQENLSPAEAWENAERVDTVYEEYNVVKRLYTVLKGKVSEFATDVHDEAIMREIGEREKADLAPGVEIGAKIEELEREVQQLPEGEPGSSPSQEQRQMGVGGISESVDDALGEIRPDEGPSPIDGGGSSQAAATDGGTDR